ncbi:MAG: ArnT family glycosyltransferase [Phycisphaerae bacterium]
MTPPARRTGGRLADVSAGAAIVAVVLWIGLPGISTAGLGWSDAPLHTLDGVFIRDFVRERPLAHPRAWAERFYLRHPAIGLVVYYPPGFAAVEAVAFALFGVSVAVARATVMVFAAGGAWMLYLLGRRRLGRAGGAAAALLLLTCPHGVLWMRDVMLEWPATFWILAAVWAYAHDRAEPRRRWAVLTAVAVAGAFFTKQTAGFIAPVLLVHALIVPGRRAYFGRAVLLGGAVLAGGLIAVYLVVAAHYAALPGRLLRVDPDFWYYIGHFPETLGWPLIPLAAAGFWVLRGRMERSAFMLPVLVVAAWYVFSSMIAAKEPRYFFFALPVLALAAAGCLVGFVGAGGTPAGSRGHRVWRYAACLVLIGVQAYLTPIARSGTLPRYAAAVTELVGRPDADLVLVDGVRDGQFVLDAYVNHAARDRIIPIRASKLLYARAARAKYGYRAFVDDEADIVDLLDRYGIRYVVIESELPSTNYRDADPPPRRMLRRLLARDPRFVLVDSWPLRCGDRAWDAVELRLYAYPGCPARQSDSIRFAMPSMGRTLSLRLPRRAGAGHESKAAR